MLGAVALERGVVLGLALGVRLAERRGYLLADELGVARAGPDVLVVLHPAVVMLLLVDLHALDVLLLEQPHARPVRKK